MGDGGMGKKAVGPVWTLGSIIAAILSWHFNKSVLWCIVHAVCDWLYVFYVVLFRDY